MLADCKLLKWGTESSSFHILVLALKKHADRLRVKITGKYNYTLKIELYLENPTTWAL